ncbi:hypothetical protein BDP81DRAFT_219632 [Colletotrichum phormii]|uniref:Uncharacterized protein n=1 Tax=Colletotrichum phormii TaxID=359342 RepID=A0AAI9ZS98_9PEZI|nr:uncharacterized protein BDP81DRAFT_219632 [Colletotrichum phormii]KAK1637168.1 hypothetical protein BDP81DRAFT_219632 [Colletotrichum phormii]
MAASVDNTLIKRNPTFLLTRLHFHPCWAEMWKPTWSLSRSRVQRDQLRSTKISGLRPHQSHLWNFRFDCAHCRYDDEVATMCSHGFRTTARVIRAQRRLVSRGVSARGENGTSRATMSGSVVEIHIGAHRWFTQDNFLFHTKCFLLASLTHSMLGDRIAVP